MGNFSVKLIEVWANNLGDFVKRKVYRGHTKMYQTHNEACHPKYIQMAAIYFLNGIEEGSMNIGACIITNVSLVNKYMYELTHSMLMATFAIC